jgi:hypothetical protein
MNIRAMSLRSSYLREGILNIVFPFLVECCMTPHKVTHAYTATSLAPGKTHYFCISAFDSVSNESPCSSEVSKPIL